MQKKLIRLALLAGAAAGALTLAGPALAAFKPKVDTSVPNGLGATGVTKIHFAIAGTDDTTASVIVYVPSGFSANLGAPGTTIGTARARVQARDLAGATVPVTGTLEIRDAGGSALVGGVPVPLALLSMGCTGTAVHTTFLVAKLSAAGQSLELPLFLDQTTGAEAAIGTYKLQFCLPPDDVAAGTPGRSPLGIKLVDAVLTFKNVFTNPTSLSLYGWISIWTPYAPGIGDANVAGTVTALAVNGLPVTLKLKGKYDKKKGAKLSGQISVGGQFQAGAKLPLFAGTKPKPLKRTGSTGATDVTGAFSAIRKIVRTTFFQARFAIPPVDVTTQGCAVLPPGLPKCVTATLGAFSVQSNVVKVAVRK